MPGIRLSGLTLGPFASAIKLLGPFRLKSLLFPVYWGSPFSYGLLGNFAQHITFLFSFSSLFSREPPGCSDCGWEVIFKEYRSWYGDDSLVSFHFISPDINVIDSRRCLTAQWCYLLHFCCFLYLLKTEQSDEDY